MSNALLWESLADCVRGPPGPPTAGPAARTANLAPRVLFGRTPVPPPAREELPSPETERRVSAQSLWFQARRHEACRWRRGIGSLAAPSTGETDGDCRASPTLRVRPMSCLRRIWSIACSMRQRSRAGSPSRSRLMRTKTRHN